MNSQHLKIRTVKHQNLQKFCMSSIKMFQMPRQEDSLRFSSALLFQASILALAGPSASMMIQVPPTCLLYCVPPLSPGLIPFTPKGTCCEEQAREPCLLSAPARSPLRAQGSHMAEWMNALSILSWEPFLLAGSESGRCWASLGKPPEATSGPFSPS